VFAQQYTMASVIANEFTEAGTPMHISALVEIGLVLFIVTFIVNAASRLLIWRMTRETKRKPVAAASTAEATS
jgi:phosphate transport system permease protein